MVRMPQIEVIAKKVEILRPLLDERLLRLWAATEAQALGHGGITAVAAATGLSRTTISAGIAQIESGAAAEADGRVRRPGGGRKRKETHDPGLLAALDALVEPGSRGDPMSPLRWTCLSVRQLATTLTGQGHPVSPQKVAQMLHEAGYSLQGTHKTLEGTTHPDRPTLTQPSLAERS
jgi:transposase